MVLSAQNSQSLVQEERTEWLYDRVSVVFHDATLLSSLGIRRAVFICRRFSSRTFLEHGNDVLDKLTLSVEKDEAVDLQVWLG